MVAEGRIESEFLKWCLSRKAFNNALREHELLRALRTHKTQRHEFPQKREKWYKYVLIFIPPLLNVM